MPDNFSTGRANRFDIDGTRNQGTASSTTISTGFVTLWDDAEEAADDTDNPIDAADAEGFEYEIPLPYRGFLAVRLNREVATESGVTYPAGTLFGKIDGSWTALPDVDGTLAPTLNTDVIVDGDVKITKEILFDLRGCEAVRFLPSTAFAATGTVASAVIEARALSLT